MITLRQLLDHVAENDYGLPAFNVNNMEQVHAIMQGAAGVHSYSGEPFLRHLIEAAIVRYPHILLCMHQDHGASPGICCVPSIPA